MPGGKQTSKGGAWTEAEDQLLAHWQSQYGNKWAEVAKHIPGKSGQQCAQRWRHRVNPNISKEKWTEAEDRKLLALVNRHGHSWAEISRRLPGRTDQQCMGRWRRHVDPSLKRQDWEEEEDEMLRELVEEYGTSSWSDISKYLGTRSAHQCRLRWCQLTGAEQPSKSSKSGRSGKTTSKSSSSSSQQAGHAGHTGNARRESSADGLAEEEEEDEEEDEDGFLSPPPATRRARSSRSTRAARRLSTMSMVGMTEDLSEDDSPPFTLRKTTARTAAKPARPAGFHDTEALAEGPYCGAEQAEQAQAAAACPAAAAAAAAPAAGTPLRELPAGGALAAQHAAAAGSVRKAAAPAALAQDPMDVCWEPSLPVQPSLQLQPPAAAAAAAAAAAPGAQAAGAGAAAAAAAAAGAPAVQPKRPRGRPRLHVRPLELPLAPEQPAPIPQAAAAGGQQAAKEEEEEESPALTHTAGPSLHLLSPSRTLSHVPPLFTPPSSVRKRALPPSRMAAFGPRPPPLSLLEDAAAGCSPLEGQPGLGEMTPVRPTPGSKGCAGDFDSGGHQPWRLTPSVLTLLQSPQAEPCGGDDLLLSPQFGGLLTPEWAKRERSQAPASENMMGRSGQRRASGAGPATSLDFTLLGTSPKKAKVEGEVSTAATVAAATALAAAVGSASWLSLAAAAAAAAASSSSGASAGGAATATATAAHLLLPETVGRTALAAALEQGLGLESIAKTPGQRAGGGLGATLTSMKGAAGGAFAPSEEEAAAGEGGPLTSASVRVQLRSLLENL